MNRVADAKGETAMNIAKLILVALMVALLFVVRKCVMFGHIVSPRPQVVIRPLLGIALGVAMAAMIMLAGATPVSAQPSEVWVDDDWTGSNPPRLQMAAALASFVEAGCFGAVSRLRLR